MGKKIVLFFLFAFILTSFVSAQPPFQTGTATSGLQVRFPQATSVKANQDVQLNTHVFNATTGVMVGNETTSCDLHIFNGTGQHSGINTLEFDTTRGDYFLNISGGNFSQVGGRVTFLIECNTTNTGGFVSGGIDITATGFEFTTAKAIYYVGLIGVLIFFFIITFFGIGLLPASNDQNPEGQIISISYLKYFRNVLWFFEWMLLLTILYTSSNVAFAYLGGQLFAKVLFMFFQIMMLLTPVIIIVWFISFFIQFHSDKEFQKLISRGIYPQGGSNI